MAIPTALLETVRPAKRDLVIRQGSSFRHAAQVSVDGVAQDLSVGAAVTAAARIKDTFTGSILATFTATVPTPATGSILLVLTSAVTAALSVPGGTDPTLREVKIGSWDCELADGTNTLMVAYGDVILLREVTT